MEDPDPTLLHAACRGDRGALTEILAFVQPPVWRFVSSLERNRETAEDLTQESLLRLLRGLPDFRGESRFRTWAFAIARNVVRDHQRAIARRPRLVGHDGFPAAGDAHDETGDRDAALIVDLQRAIGHLPPELREVFVLIEVSGLRYREVAEILDLAEGTVKSRMFHSRRELIRHLEIRESE